MKKNLFFKAFLPILVLFTQMTVWSSQPSAVHAYAVSGKLNELKNLHSDIVNKNLNIRNDRGQTPLFAAFFSRNLNIVAYLLGKYPELWFQTTPKNTQNNYLNGGDTILHWLTKRILAPRFTSNRSNFLQIALNAPPYSYSIRNHSGQTPVHTLAGAKPEKTSDERNKKFDPEGKKDLIDEEKVIDPNTLLKYNDDAEKLMERIANKQNVNALDDAGRTALHFAAMNGYPQLALVLINKGANVNLIDEQRKTPLHYAAMKGFIPIIKTLLNFGKEQLVNFKDIVNLKDKRGRTPLHWVQRMRVGSTAYKTTPYHMTKQAALEAIQLLLQADANPTIKDNDGRNALGWAQLAEERAKKYGYPSGNYNQEIALLQKYTPKTQTFQNQQQPSSKTGLTQQFNTMQLQQPQQYLQHQTSYIPSSAPAQQQPFSSSSGNWLSADQQYKQQYQQTIAASLQQAKLDQQKWQPQTTTTKITTRQLTHGDKALFKAAQNNDETQALNAIFNLQANVNARDTRSQNTPLHTAAVHNNTEIIEILLNNNAKISAKDNRGNTPLHKAAVWESQEALNALINAGADIYAKNNYGETPEKSAQIRSKKSTAALLASIRKQRQQQTSSSTSSQSPSYFSQSFPLSNATTTSYTIDDLFDTMAAFKHDAQKANTILQGNKALANTANQTGIKPLNHIAGMGPGFFNSQSQNNLLKIAAMLINNGAAINGKDNRGKTPLMSAVETANDAMVELLLQSGADVTLKNNSGRLLINVAYEVAKKQPQDNIVGDLNKVRYYIIRAIAQWKKSKQRRK